MTTIADVPLQELLANQPWVKDHLAAHGITPPLHLTFRQMVATLDESFFAKLGSGRPQFLADFELFAAQMAEIGGARRTNLKALRVHPGQDKNGTPEPMGVTLRIGQVTAVVGPTGSGKSRLLEDIECLAQRDTPTLRAVLIDDQTPTAEARFASEGRLVAQLSQNMSFVMDLSVEDFLTMHAESRMIRDIPGTVSTIFAQANALAGEPVPSTHPGTRLSGGQSRALMIADTALLSPAPIVLIDEIENAGVDKVKALGLLVSAEKIVLISTHDPLLALGADQRLIIQNGAIRDVITTSDDERATLAELRRMDTTLADLRTRLRRGERLGR
jgi:ABC-type lipoprotein export system ATPase subunit